MIFDGLDSFINSFFNMSISCDQLNFPECQSLRDEFGRLEADLKLKGQGCCGSKAALIRNFSRKVKEFWPPKQV